MNPQAEKFWFCTWVVHPIHDLFLFLYDVDYYNPQLAKWAKKQTEIQLGMTIDDHGSVIDSRISTSIKNKGII